MQEESCELFFIIFISISIQDDERTLIPLDLNFFIHGQHEFMLLA